MSAVEEIESDLKALLNGEFSSLHIMFNDAHAPNYQTALQWAQSEQIGEGYNDFDDWVSAEEREKALATNSVWTCHWYPNTPIGFNVLHASSLVALLTAIHDLVVPEAAV